MVLIVLVSFLVYILLTKDANGRLEECEFILTGTRLDSSRNFSSNGRHFPVANQTPALNPKQNKIRCNFIESQGFLIT